MMMLVVITTLTTSKMHRRMNKLLGNAFYTAILAIARRYHIITPTTDGFRKWPTQFLLLSARYCNNMDIVLSSPSTVLSAAYTKFSNFTNIITLCKQNMQKWQVVFGSVLRYDHNVLLLFVLYTFAYS